MLLRLQVKEEDVKIVVSGAGAAAVSITKLYLRWVPIYYIV